MMAGYDIDFIGVRRLDIYGGAFDELTNLLFSRLIQRLFNEAGITEMLGVDERVVTTDTVQTKTLKDTNSLALPSRSSKPVTTP